MGAFAAGNRLFLITPFLITIVAVFGIINLWINYSGSHPFEKNRAKYLLLANFILLFAALDFLPHFGFDFFGGPVSGITIPIFLAIYSYAMLRYRLIEFHSFITRAAGWFLAVVSMVIVYALTVEVGRRVGAPLPQTYVIASIAGFVVWLGVGRHLPDWAQRAFSQESEFRYRVQLFNDEIISIQDETLLLAKLRALCVCEFGPMTVRYVEDIENLAATAISHARKLSSEDIVEI